MMYSCGHEHEVFDHCESSNVCAECSHRHTDCSLVAVAGAQSVFPDGEWMCWWCMTTDYDNDPKRTDSLV